MSSQFSIALSVWLLRAATADVQLTPPPKPRPAAPAPTAVERPASAPARPATAPPPAAETVPASLADLTASVDPVTVASVNRLIETLFKIGWRVESQAAGGETTSAEYRRQLDRLRDDVSTMQRQARGGASVPASAYKRLQEQLLTLARQSGTPVQ